MLDINNGVCIQWGFIQSAPANKWNIYDPPIQHTLRSLVCSGLDANGNIAVSRGTQKINLYTTQTQNLEWIAIG